MSLKKERLRRSWALLTAFMTLVALVVPLTGIATANHGTKTLNVTPDSDNNPVNGTHTLTATLSSPADAGAINIDFEIDCLTACTGAADYDAVQGGVGANIDEAPTDGAQAEGTTDNTPATPDLSCQIPEGQSACTVQYTRDNAGTENILGFVDEGGDNSRGNDDPNADDTVTKTWSAPVATTIDCDDASGNDTDTNPVDGSELYTCTVQDQFGSPVSGALVDLEIQGPNDPDSSGFATDGTPDVNNVGGSTNGAGQVTYTFNPAGDAAVGTDELCFWIDSDNDAIYEVHLADTEDGDACANSEAVGETENNDDTDKVSKTWQARAATNLDCTPESATNPAGTQHQITCNVQDQFGTDMPGAQVDGEILNGSPNDTDGTNSPPDFNSFTTDAGGDAVITYTGGATAGTDQICFWIDDDANDTNLNEGQTVCTQDADTDQVSKTWTSGQEQAVECTPERSANHRSLAHTITCQLVDSSDETTNVTTSGVQVKAEATGANDPDGANPSATPDFTCTTNASGNCSFTHDPGGVGAAPPLATVGTTTYRAWVGTAPDAAEGRDEDAVPGSTLEPGNDADNTDVVEKTWHAEGASLALTPESDTAASGVCNVFTTTVLDSGGRPVGNAQIDVRQRHADFGTANAGPEDEPTFCNAAQVAAADPNAPNPSNVNPYGQLPGNDAQTQGQTVNGTNADGQVSFGIRLDGGTGVVTVLSFCEDTPECPTGIPNNNTAENNEPQDQSTKTWGEGGADAIDEVDAEPETATNPNGTTHTFTATLTNDQGDPIQGVTPLAAIVAGPNAGAVTITCGPSNAQGVSTCTYTDSGASPVGTDEIEVWVNQSAAAGGGSVGRDAGEPFDEISKTWVTPPQGLSIDVTCDDSDGPSGDSTADNDLAVETTIDCRNPLSQPNETFRALVTNPNGTATTNDDTPESGIQVRFAITFESQADMGLVEAGGANGPAICTTGADGTCSVTLNNPTPQAFEEADVLGVIAGQTSAAPFGNTADQATKQWLAAGQAAFLTLTPQGATNQTGTSHTVTATVVDVFGDPVAGENVDFQITGRNPLTDFDNVTDANGQATFTYNDGGNPATAGPDDNITAWADNIIENDQADTDEPVDTARKVWVTQVPNTTNVRLDMEMDDNFNTDDCPNNLTAVGAPNETGAGGFNDDAEAPNGVNTQHEICAVAFDENNNPIVGGEITFTLTGAGNFTNGAGANLGNSVTIPTDQAGHAHTRITSAATGTTTVTATKDNISDSGDKSWVALPPRNIDCTPEDGLNEPGDDHEVDCLVTDRQGNPVAGWNVFGTETGPGSIQQTGGIACDPLVTGSPNTCIQVTDANGVAPFVLQNNTNQVGEQTFDAELTGDVGGGRATTNAAVDECERPANNPAGAPAGNCTDQVTKTWQVDVDECSDGADNDGDGLIDFPDDPGCDSPEDDDESDEQPEVTRGPCQGFQEGSENTDPALSGRIIVGTQGSDILTGTAGDDIICGLDGNDIIDGGGGDDLIVGNQGNDTIAGSGGKDNINGNRDNDTIDGNRKNDVLRGSRGDDTIRGNRGHDTIRGGNGNDTLQGGKGADLLRGGGGNDTLKGWTGDDILNGGSGTDTCRPGRGNDRVRNCER